MSNPDGSEVKASTFGRFGGDFVAISLTDIVNVGECKDKASNSTLCHLVPFNFVR